MPTHFKDFNAEEAKKIAVIKQAVESQQVIMAALEGEQNRVFAGILIRLGLDKTTPGVKRTIKFDLVKNLVVIDETPEILT